MTMGRRTDPEIAAFLISTWGDAATGLDEAAIAERLMSREGWRAQRARRAVARLAAAGDLRPDGSATTVASSPCLLSGND